MSRSAGEALAPHSPLRTIEKTLAAKYHRYYVLYRLLEALMLCADGILNTSLKRLQLIVKVHNLADYF